jgi:hypothetical protein
MCNRLYVEYKIKLAMLIYNAWSFIITGRSCRMNGVVLLLNKNAYQVYMYETYGQFGTPVLMLLYN